MIQDKFRPMHGLGFTEQSNFDMQYNFLSNQLKKAASVTDFSSTSVKHPKNCETALMGQREALSKERIY